ncbi:MAG: hypothetical protein ACREBS_04515 [Nitrososphaerales archaeon]
MDGQEKPENGIKSQDNPESPPKLKASDKIWVGLALGVFVALFIVILVYDMI